MPRHAQAPLSYLDAPLDSLLGRVSHVRILRVLAEWGTPLPAIELAKATELDLSGVGRAIDRLAQLGVVRLLGVGRGRVVELSSTHSFTPALRTLFQAERERRQQLLATLRDLMDTLQPPPRAAWIEGPHASGKDRADDALRIGVLTGVRERHLLEGHLTERLREVTRRFDLTIDLVIRTRADLETLSQPQIDSLRAATLLYGVLPLAPKSEGAQDPAPRTHAHLDQQSREHGGRLAKAILADPRLVERAQQWVAARMPKASEAERHELREWEEILTWPPHRLSAFLRDGGERATRLRQTSPFVQVEMRGTSGAAR
jgi:DNA-binding transcriptional ArsR family regulator